MGKVKFLSSLDRSYLGRAWMPISLKYWTSGIDCAYSPGYSD